MRKLMLFVLVAGALVVAPAPGRASERPYRPGEGDPRLDAAANAVRLGIPRRLEVSRDAAVVEIPVVIHPIGLNGTIDRVEFADFAVNGIPFDVEPFEARFDLPEREPVELGAPLRLRVTFASIAPGVVEEVLLPSESLRLTGTVTVSGTFRKWIFSLTRSVEIPVDVTRPNPVAPYHPGRYLLKKWDAWIP
jgi:hypothetical protein